MTENEVGSCLIEAAIEVHYGAAFLKDGIVRAVNNLPE